MERRSFTVDRDGVRLDIMLNENINDYSRNHIQTFIKDGRVSVDGLVVLKKNTKLKTGQSIDVEVPEPEVLEVLAEDIPIEIIYEDEDVIIVNKPAGMVVHPAPGNYSGTLVNALMFHAKSLSSINGVIRPGIVHRIDKDTSGLLMIAKNNQAHQSLAEQLKEHTITREYYAIVHQSFTEPTGFVDAPVGRHPKDRLKMAVIPDGRHAVTHYEVIENFMDYALVACRLETGRTHQIRVHMKHIGHPLVGDPVYGRVKPKIKHNGQLLHARLLGFIHPRTGKYIEFEAPLPDHFAKIMKKVESVSEKREFHGV